MFMHRSNLQRTESSTGWLSSMVHVGSTVVLALLVAATALHAQDKNPYAGDAKIAKVGEYQFRSNCAFCHGLGARGGGRGPDLTRGQKHHGNTDAEIFHNIHDGITGTAMPAATNGGIGVGMSDDEIWQVVTYLRSVEKMASATVTGDAAHGKELFFGTAACGTCHMVNGKGNVKRLDATWRLKKLDDTTTQVVLELLIVPDMPVPDSLVVPEVRFAAAKAVEGSRDEAEKRKPH